MQAEDLLLPRPMARPEADDQFCFGSLPRFFHIDSIRPPSSRDPCVDALSVQSRGSIWSVARKLRVP